MGQWQVEPGGEVGGGEVVARIERDSVEDSATRAGGQVVAQAGERAQFAFLRAAGAAPLAGRERQPTTPLHPGGAGGNLRVFQRHAPRGMHTCR